MGTCYNCLAEAVQTSTNNLCFGAKQKNRYTPAYPSFAFDGVHIPWTFSPDVTCLNKNDFNDTNACVSIAMYGHVHSYLRDVYSRHLGVSHMTVLAARSAILICLILYFTLRQTAS